MAILAPESAQAPAKPPSSKKDGIGYWMERVIEEAAAASSDFAPDPVHDLRVALRRCRSMGDSLRDIDSDPTWQKMRRAGKVLFSKLGELRDTQVMQEWVNTLAPPDDAAAERLNQYCRTQEQEFKGQATLALNDFDQKQWLGWAKYLNQRAERVPPGNVVFEVLALEQWLEARQLHRLAMRNRSQVTVHALRIGIKKFRYVVENFLPIHHEKWLKDLKSAQDALGEIHDLDVLWNTAIRIKAFATTEERTNWRNRVQEARKKRLEAYRSRALGKHSIWDHWRSELPQGDALREASLKKLATWASFLDPDPEHTGRVLALALNFYEQLCSAGLIKSADCAKDKDLLRVAALTHEVGRAKKDHGHAKRTQRMVQSLKPPPTWNGSMLEISGAIARMHCGKLPQNGSALAAFPKEVKELVLQLGGILRLSDAIDHIPGLQASLKVDPKREALVLKIRGSQSGFRDGEALATASYLLETALNRPITIQQDKSKTNQQG